MKILVSAYACEPNKGGEMGNGYNMVLNMAELGHEVWCLTSTYHISEEVQSFFREHPHPNLNFVLVPLPSWVDIFFEYELGFYVHYLYWQKKAYQVAKKLDVEKDFDLIHHITIGSPQLGSSLWKLNKKMVFGPCGGGQDAPKAFKKYFYHWWKLEIVRTWISKLLLTFNKDAKKTLRNAELVLTTNYETLDLVSDVGAPNAHLFLDTSLPEEFFPEEFPERSRGEKLRILWVGRLFPRKGLPLVLEALSKVSPDIPFKLTILGDGQMGSFMEEWLTEFNLKEKVDWRGMVPWADVREAYLTHDLFMFTSLRDSSAFQYLEAMACGLPILTLDLHGAKSLVPDGAGIKVPVTTPDETAALLAKGVEDLYHNPAQCEAYGRYAYEFALTQTWKNKARKISSYYESFFDLVK
ncbi:MAG: glycosyltransferase family 4 protein [Bacteroidota bacterium]